jgi:hypothetical protein
LESLILSLIKLLRIFTAKETTPITELSSDSEGLLVGDTAAFVYVTQILKWVEVG